jgi:hypothetical protein
MKQALYLTLAIGLMVPFALGADQVQTPPAPLNRAHAHNDYEHKRPLLDALNQGFCSVEADVYLIGGQLLVAHDRDKVAPERTLQALYLDPLRQRARHNGGRIYRNGPTMTLLVDIKSEAEATYAALRDQLKAYSDIVTTFSPDNTETRALTVIVSGNRPRKTMAEEPIRYAALDGRLDDLNAGESKHFIPLISDNWSQLFKWRGLGPFPADEQTRLQQIVEKAHRQGRRVRFWAAPDQALGWRALLEAKVDLINTDNLTGLKDFLLANDR